MRRSNIAVASAVHEALSKVRIEGNKVEWSEMRKRWEIRDPEATGARGENLLAYADTLEGLEASLKRRKALAKKKPFKKDHVIVFRTHNKPYIGTVTSRPSDTEVWVTRDDEHASTSGKTRERLRVMGGYQPEVFGYSEEAFELLCDLKTLEAEWRRKDAALRKKLAETLKPWEPSEKDHPVIS
jgi:hypothetical protein